LQWYLLIISERLPSYLKPDSDSSAYEIIFEAMFLSAYNNIGISLFFSFFNIEVFYYVLPIPQNKYLLILNVTFRYGACFLVTWTLWYTLSLSMIIVLSLIHTLDLAIKACLRLSAKCEVSSPKVVGRVSATKYFLGKVVLTTQGQLNVLQVFLNDVTETIAPLGLFFAELIFVACNVTCLKIWKEDICPVVSNCGNVSIYCALHYWYSIRERTAFWKGIWGLPQTLIGIGLEL